jgi:hypothetical protein
MHPSNGSSMFFLVMARKQIQTRIKNKEIQRR